MMQDLFSLKGRTALVTGGSRGIGRMIAAGFSAKYAPGRVTGCAGATFARCSLRIGVEPLNRTFVT
mgnify:CR=1 FL=1